MSKGTESIGVSRCTGRPNWIVKVEARLDTGASRSSIDLAFAELLHLDLVGEVKVRNANGVEIRDTVYITIIKGNREVELEVSLADRVSMNYPVILGRDYLEAMG